MDKIITAAVPLGGGLGVEKEGGVGCSGLQLSHIATKRVALELLHYS